MQTYFRPGIQPKFWLFLNDDFLFQSITMKRFFSGICAFVSSWFALSCSGACSELILSKPFAEDCPVDWSIVELGCGWYAFSVPNAGPEALAEWTINGTTFTNSGQSFTYQFEDGTIELSVLFTDPVCPSFSAAQSLIIDCSGDCPNGFSITEGSGCGQYVLSFDDLHPDQSVVWETTFNGVPWQESTNGFEPYVQVFPGPELYEVCASYQSPGCPGGAFICQELAAPPCEQNTCGYLIQTTQFDCNGLTFFIPGISDDVEVHWDMGDGNQWVTQGGGPFSYAYASESCYGVHATFQTDACPGTVQLFHFAMAICEVFQCQAVSLSAVPQDGPVLWWIETTDGVIFHQGLCTETDCLFDLCMSTGCYVLKINPDWVGEDFFLVFSSSADVALTYLSTENFIASFLLSINSDCTANCTTAVNYNVTNNSDYFFFVEAGSLTPAYWTLPDGSAATGPSVTLVLTEAGTYEICAHFASDACGDPSQCISVVLYEGGCTEAGFILMSDVAVGGPPQATWTLAHTEGLFAQTGEVLFDAANDFFGFSECLPNGCYELVVTASQTLDANNFAALITGPWLILQDSVAWDGNFYEYSVLLGMQSDCMVSPACALDIEDITTDGFNFFFSASETSDLTPMEWTLPGLTVQGPTAQVAFQQAGIFEVCAIGQSPDCGVVTQCLEVEITTDSCDLATSVLTLPAPANNDQMWPWLLWNGLSESVYAQGTWSIGAGSTSVNHTLCLPPGCYEFILTLPAGVPDPYPISFDIAINGLPWVPFNQPFWLGNSYHQDLDVNFNCFGYVTGNEGGTAISVFPNPSEGHVQLSGPQHEVLRCTLFSVPGSLGKEILLLPGQTQLDYSHMAPGIYLHRIQTLTGALLMQGKLVIRTY